MFTTLQSVSALLLSAAILCIGHGLGNTLLGVRADLEAFPAWGIGLMSSAYFAGFIVGVHWCYRLLPKVGHIRAFSALASLASALSLMHLLLLDLWSWILLRGLYGICIAGLYMVIESWLNALATPAYRSRILSTYMVINFSGLGAGQLLFGTASPADPTLFLLTSITISLALIPLTLSRARQPELGQSVHLRVRQLLKRIPLSMIGCTITGMIAGSYWGLNALYLSRSGLAPEEVAHALLAGFIGGLLVQWPVGILSDRFDRRYTILGMLSLGMVSGIALTLAMQHGLRGFPLYALTLLFGGALYTLYSLFIALASDQLDAAHVVSSSGSLIMMHASGAIAGPLLVGVTMYGLGRDTYFPALTLFYLILLLFIVAQLRSRPAAAQPAESTFIAIPRTTPALVTLDDRAEPSEPAQSSAR